MRIFANPNYNFIKWRWHALVLSFAVIGSGLVTVIGRGGLPLGVDFSGGTVLVLRFQQPTTEQTVRDALAKIATDSVVQQYGQGGNQVMVRLPIAAQGVTLDQDAQRIVDGLNAANIAAFEVAKKDIVGPVIGSDLRRKGTWATLTAIGGILVYIGFRFRFSFAIGAVFATFHDILVTLAFLTWFGYDLSLNTIAAILTIAGYSVNDTIVVFDRVREDQRIMRKEPLEVIVNRAVNQTLGRTVITAGVTFLAVLALFLFGGEVLHGFAFTMLVGIITGTYSTVFIAAAIAIILSRGRKPKPGTQAQARARQAG